MRRGPLTGILLAALMIACANASTPREAAEGYLAALEVLDFDRAAQYVTLDGRQGIHELRRIYQALPPAEQAKFPMHHWMVDQVYVTSQTASVTFHFDEGKRGQLELKFADGRWNVDHRQTF